MFGLSSGQENGLKSRQETGLKSGLETGLIFLLIWSLLWCRLLSLVLTLTHSSPVLTPEGVFLMPPWTLVPLSPEWVSVPVYQRWSRCCCCLCNCRGNKAELHHKLSHLSLSHELKSSVSHWATTNTVITAEDKAALHHAEIQTDWYPHPLTTKPSNLHPNRMNKHSDSHLQPNLSWRWQKVSGYSVTSDWNKVLTLEMRLPP